MANDQLWIPSLLIFALRRWGGGGGENNRTTCFIKLKLALSNKTSARFVSDLWQQETSALASPREATAVNGSYYGKILARIFFFKQEKKKKKEYVMLLWQQLFEKYCNKRQSNIKLPSWYFEYLVFLLSSWFYRDPLPLPFLATSVRAQVREHLQIVCVHRISVLELQNLRYGRFLHLTGRTHSVIWAECLTHIPIRAHFVVFPVCTFGTEVFWDSLVTGSHQPLCKYHINCWNTAVSFLFRMCTCTSPAAGSPAHSEEFKQNATPYLSKARSWITYLIIFFKKFLWMSPSFSMYSPSPYFEVLR